MTVQCTVRATELTAVFSPQRKYKTARSNLQSAVDCNIKKHPKTIFRGVFLLLFLSLKQIFSLILF